MPRGIIYTCIYRVSHVTLAMLFNEKEKTKEKVRDKTQEPYAVGSSDLAVTIEHRMGSKSYLARCFINLIFR